MCTKLLDRRGNLSMSDFLQLDKIYTTVENKQAYLAKKFNTPTEKKIIGSLRR